MPHQSSSLMNSIVSYKLSMAHKFSNIKAITVLCKSAENLALSTLAYLAENKTVKKCHLQAPPLPASSPSLSLGENYGICTRLEQEFALANSKQLQHQNSIYPLVRATWKSRERGSSDSFIIHLDNVA